MVKLGVIALLEKEQHVVDTIEAAKFFVDAINVDNLQPFMECEKTLADAARELSISQSRMSYWAKKMQRLGLVYKVRTEKRGKHNVSLYRSAAHAFVIPIELVADNPYKGVFNVDTFERTVTDSLVHAAHSHFKGWHVRYALEGEQATLRVLPQGQSAEDPDVTNYWGQLKLSKEQARAFHGEMRKLFEAFASQAHSEKSSDYVFKLVLVEKWPQ